MRKTIRRTASLATAAFAAAAFSMGASAQAQTTQAGDWAGCPSGAVCIYPQNQDPAVKPSNIYWSYGAHNLKNQVGKHWVLNNQTGGAHAVLCNGTNGSGTCHHDMRAQFGYYTDLTPVNSIVLKRP